MTVASARDEELAKYSALAKLAAFGRHGGHPLDAKVMSGKARLAEESWT